MTGSKLGDENEPPLSGIVLDLQPEPFDLHCAEVLQESEEEQEQVEQLSLEPYEVGSACGSCDKKVKFSVLADADAILLLQQLMVEDSLKFLCNVCARRNKDNGR